MNVRNWRASGSTTPASAGNETGGIIRPEAYTIYNGKHSLAFVPLKGWSQIEFIRTKGLHPETQFAKTINATVDVSGPTALKTLMLFKVGRFKPEEIQKTLDQL